MTEAARDETPEEITVAQGLRDLERTALEARVLLEVRDNIARSAAEHTRIHTPDDGCVSDHRGKRHHGEHAPSECGDPACLHAYYLEKDRDAARLYRKERGVRMRSKAQQEKVARRRKVAARSKRRNRGR